ncbi:alpha/beta fold hydrolase [Phenylobacterium sp.]|uniref:alpha/beta fold hydrolase n=1 Tax=Phenylobacterium sp. TaxID=1871053 RepID=UPI0035ADE9E3
MREKPHLLLLPGMICDEAFWRAQVEALAGICEPAVMNFGVLDSFEAMARSVLADAPARFALAGHSMGGRVALEIMRLAPERVLKLALAATDYRGHESAETRAAEAARRDMMLAKATADGMDGFGRMWLSQILPPYRLADEALAADVLAMMARQPVEALAAQTRAALMRGDHSKLLATISCPTLICAGDDDPLRPVAIHQRMAEQIAGARLVVIERCGHMVAMERPEAVTAALENWLLA